MCVQSFKLSLEQSSELWQTLIWRSLCDAKLLVKRQGIHGNALRVANKKHEFKQHVFFFTLSLKQMWQRPRTPVETMTNKGEMNCWGVGPNCTCLIVMNFDWSTGSLNFKKKIRNKKSTQMGLEIPNIFCHNSRLCSLSRTVIWMLWTF